MPSRMISNVIWGSPGDGRPPQSGGVYEDDVGAGLTVGAAAADAGGRTGAAAAAEDGGSIPSFADWDDDDDDSPFLVLPPPAVGGGGIFAADVEPSIWAFLIGSKLVFLQPVTWECG